MSRKIIDRAHKLLPSKVSKAMQDFVTEFFKTVPTDDVNNMDPELIAETVQRHWDMSQRRQPGEVMIDIYTIAPEFSASGATPRRAGKTIINIVNDDMAFLVDSVAAEIGRHNRLISLLLHPILQAHYSSAGKLTNLTALPRGKNKISNKDNAQSHMHIHLEGAIPNSLIPVLEADLKRVLRDVRYATQHWHTMRDKLEEAQTTLRNAPGRYPRADIEEYINFLNYLHKDNFTLLGYREYKFVEKNGKLTSETVKGSSRGLLHDDLAPVYITQNKHGLPQDLQEMRRDLPPLAISKVNRRSTVHRSVPLDAIAVKTYDKNGKVTGERLFIGLLTSVTYSRSIQDIPLLRHKAAAVLTKSGFKESSHNYKALRHILEKYPRDELFQITSDSLLKIALSILRLQERQRIALYTRRDPFRRYISCLVYVPRDRYDTRLRQTIQKILEQEMNGKCDVFYTNLDDSVLARVIYIVNTDQNNLPRFNTDKIEARLQEVGRAWSERLFDALLDARLEESTVPDIVHKYGEAFPISYIEEYNPQQAVHDIYKIEDLMANGTMTADLYRCEDCTENQLRLKLYQKDSPVILSDILPVLKNMGLQVLSELPFEVSLPDDKTVWIHDFMMTTKVALDISHIEQGKAEFENALLRVGSGDLENDGLNRLILQAKMNWRDVLILRGYSHYLRQMRLPFSPQLIERTLYRHADIARQLVDLFKLLHDPAQQTNDEKARKKNKDAAHKALFTALDAVESLEEDNILRTLINLIESTLRTNFFQRDEKGDLKSYIALKFDSRAIEALPEPKPYRETYVYSARVEGVHLRGDVIARGGIRWSDRFEDFRTEVLGLMRAQQVKNSLIVPMGAKGGFVVKKPPMNGGRAAYQAEGIACYKIFIGSLLEITDNRKGRKVVPPRDVVRHDGDDPYLVVAADKGTATFSDIANSLSLNAGFWLADAFASGGSAGYDHKKMGITARGAWESVKRHFRELNHDTQTTAFDVVGVGDMGGDVFGNGMLLSEHIKLIGAFNHLHIFCDPDPDAARSYKERARLFAEVKGWDEYNTKLLSAGGRIYQRSEKSLLLTAEIRKRFDIDRERVSPNELIQAMLRARTDLLWFGGIGTYVKSSEETQADVGDKGNDYLRVDATAIRARVIGEGANLAITQAARIEFAAQGGKINADFIDNSGGVNSSDLEVNIKILLSDVMNNDAHKMTLAKRNKLLASMTDEVAQLVLTNNYQQSQGISLMERLAAEHFQTQAAFIDDLERYHGLKRRLEGLPDQEEIESRLRAGRGLTRPELALLQAYSKILFTKDMIASTVPDTTAMQDDWLFNYFPEPLRKKYAQEIRGHRLRREIIATNLATAIVNRMGPTFVKQMMDKTGASSADVARVYIAVKDVFGLDQLWAQIEALDNKAAANVQLNLMRHISRMVERETLWFLTRLGRPLDHATDIPRFRKGVEELRRVMLDVVTPDRAEDIEQRTQAALSDGLPLPVAREAGMIGPLGAACDLTRISSDLKIDIAHVARVYYELGSYFHLHWLRQQARQMRSESRWSSEAIEGIIDQLYSCQAGLTIRILRDMKGALKTIDQKAEKSAKARKTTKAVTTSPAPVSDSIVQQWVLNHMPQAALFEPFFADLRATTALDMSMLIIAEHRLRRLYGG